MGQKRQRTCVVCGQTTNKDELLRFVRNCGTIALDTTGRASGRGAYVCASHASGFDVRTKRGLERSLRIRIDERAWGSLVQEFERVARTDVTHAKDRW